ncbi:acetyl-coenzyme A transporter 1-like [Anneissia japonica]|uniref:acetyl-coenzyme A transporter 1-like n=1 Tax=Anneissia japonica TaxID=1529436 RepID=UPI001425A3AA|nr:acetyl-coenzyme A transporter 1-like [Anneissia japonica]
MLSRKRNSKPKYPSTKVSDSEDEGKHMEEIETQMMIPDSNKKTRPIGLQGDRSNVAILLFLYILQGIPLGLAGSLPLVLQGYKISYKQQAMISFIFWPFSMKLLWAPIVDAVYIARLGRRKTWLVPTQYFIGFTMIALSGSVNSLLGEKGSDFEPNVFALTALFFFLNFLAATQDIAVDGWALTMLAKHNLGYASTCNSVGQTAGYFLGNVVFLAFESAEFCNAYIRSEPADKGLFTLSDFLFFWGIVFIVCTTLVLIFKHERKDEDESIEGVFGTFKQLYQILKLESVRQYIVICLTIKIGFAAADSVTGLKLIEAGVPKEKLAMMAVPLVPIQIILPWVIAKYTAGPKPLNVMLKAMPFRLMMGLVFMIIVKWTPTVKLENGDFPFYYYLIILLSYGCHQVTLYCMFVAAMAFHSKISDPLIGGTYVTLLNTVSNLGGNWPATVALWFIDFLTFRSCHGVSSQEYDCDVKEDREVCLKAGGVCQIDYDGYFIESIAFLLVGMLWLKLMSKKTKQLQNPDVEWRLSTVWRD